MANGITKKAAIIETFKNSPEGIKNGDVVEMVKTKYGLTVTKQAVASTKSTWKNSGGKAKAAGTTTVKRRGRRAKTATMATIASSAVTAQTLQETKAIIEESGSDWVKGFLDQIDSLGGIELVRANIATLEQLQV